MGRGGKKIEKTGVWFAVVSAGDCIPCGDCGEPMCPVCDIHYADCQCPGPTMDGYEYRRFRGMLFARPTVQ